MNVQKIILTPYAIPLHEPLSTASKKIRSRRGMVVQMRTEKGWGLGDMAPHPALGRVGWEDFRREAQSIAERLCGSSLGSLAAADWSGMEPGAAMGLEMALYDAAARDAGVSLARFLGARGSGPTASSALLRGDAPLASAAELFAMGYRTAKFKAHPDPQQTLSEIHAIREALPQLGLRLDVNGAWSRQTAVEFCGGLRQNSLEWIEQPVWRQDLVGMRAVRENGVRVAADESVRTVEDVSRLASEKSADVIVIKLMQVGGIAAAMRVAAEAKRHGLQICLTTGLDSSIATSAVLHLSAVLEPETANGFSTLSLLEGDLVEQALHEGPLMDVPAGLGLGVSLDAESPFLLPDEIHQSG
ncbi:MAG: o-succinylbenzoate synthase [Candidatus Binatia bacterium]|nr:o-succinylbenzoate synthase [Candidatus Binatia bacterium]MDG1959439.1 o-succinylbenzoate synthase [Candidatus Binatia bacterium]MDG2010499.1 o-succinylbenzoate synthase [Candidatus Binatia bacterium]